MLIALQEMERLEEKIGELNETLFNPVGLNILWPRNVAFLFVRTISLFPSSLGRLTDGLIYIIFLHQLVHCLPPKMARSFR